MNNNGFELDDNMLKILRYIYKKLKIRKTKNLKYSKVTKRFRRIDDIGARLSVLKKHGYISFDIHVHCEDGKRPDYYHEDEDTIWCTYLGNRIVQDGFLFTREYFAHSVITPVAVSVLTTLLLQLLIS